MGDRMTFRGAIAAAIAAFALLAGAGIATAASTPSGSTFAVGYLPLPPGSVSGSASGSAGMGYSESPVSGNGRFVLFLSMSNNLAPGIGPDENNLFRKDTRTGKIVLVNRKSGKNGKVIGGYIQTLGISSDGKKAIFVTDASGVASDTDGKYDVYLRDIAKGKTKLMTPGTDSDVYDADISGDGKYVAFSTVSPLVAGDMNGSEDVYRRNIVTGKVDLVSRIPASETAGSGDSYEVSLGSDGRWVAFDSRSTDLVPGFVNMNGSESDVYLRDMNPGGQTTLVSARFDSPTTSGNDGSVEPDIAGTSPTLAGMRVAFASYATDLADNMVTDPSGNSSVYYRSMAATTPELISRASGAAGANADSRAHTPSISANGKRIIFSSDATNLGPPPDYYGVYMRDRSNLKTTLVSADNEYAVQGSISGDGKSATWGENGGATADSDPDIPSVFFRSLPKGKIKLMSRPQGTRKVRVPGFYMDFATGGRSLSADGRYVVFTGYSKNLPFGSYDAAHVYRRDLKTGKIELVSRATGANGTVANGGQPSVSEDGNLVAFVAWESLDPADTNDDGDIYVRNMKTNVTSLASRANGAGGAVASDGAQTPSISGNGQRVAFSSTSTNLGAPGGTDRIYVRDLQASTTTVASRADGNAGAIGNATSSYPVMSSDGSKVAFVSYSTNLDPADAASNQSAFVRNLATDDTELVSRAQGPGGASLGNYVYDLTISGDGNTVAFDTSDSAAVPDTAPWAPTTFQVVVRNLTTGTNVLASRTADGKAGEDGAQDASLSSDGNIVAFDTTSPDIRQDLDHGNSRVVAIRDLTNSTVFGPPVFGPNALFTNGAFDPIVSPNGKCILFRAGGYNAISGDIGDIESGYIYSRGGCLDPRSGKPRLTRVKVRPAVFRVAGKPTPTISAKSAPRGSRFFFSLNTRATVTVSFKRKGGRGFVNVGKLVRKNLGIGENSIAFSGRVGKKSLRPGAYRAVLSAKNSYGKSKPVTVAFTVLRG